MNIHISEGNKGIGKIPNFNLPPIITCKKGVKCKSVCYAMKAYRLYPSVKKAWDENLYNCKHFMRHTELAIMQWLEENKPSHFRIHSAGDFFSEKYLGMWLKIINTTNIGGIETRFMAFSKQPYAIGAHAIGLTILQSPDIIPDTAEEAEKIATEYKTFVCRKTLKHVKTCVECGYLCWRLSKTAPIFIKH